MEISQLRTFLAVASAKSFMKAADDLYVSRQAISKTIRQLEEELGLELFIRNQKGAMMTPAGVFLYPRASALLAEFDKLKQDTMDIRRTYRPTMRLFLSQGIYGFYAEKLMEYGIKYSSELELIINNCLDSDCETLLSERKAEAVVSFTRPSENVARSVRIANSPLIILINKNNPLANSEKVNMKSLFKLPMLLYTISQGHCPWWFDYPKGTDICCSDLDYIFTLLRQDKGILPIPKIAIPSFLDFAKEVTAPSAINPIPVYFSTLHPDHYNAIDFSLLDDMQANVFSEKK